MYTRDPFRIWYIAKEFKRGVCDVKLLVVKPNNSVDGVFLMEEDSSGMGCYYYDYSPPIAGKYLFMVVCPSQNVKHVSSEMFVDREARKPVVSFSR